MALRHFFLEKLRVLPRVVIVSSRINKMHSSAFLRKVEDRKEMLASLPAKDEGTAGERSVDIDTLMNRKDKFFPDATTVSQYFHGTPFIELPVCNIRVSKNNTIISVADNKGTIRLLRSCGIEGFKNTRKGTNIAAQATAVFIGLKTVELGWKTLRVKVRGLGPGRMSAIKGLEMSGLNIVSITDNTPVSWYPPRPRKQRKL